MRDGESGSFSKIQVIAQAKKLPGRNAVFVERLMPAARARLVVIADDAPLIEAAKLLRSGTDLIVVCGSGGIVSGVITKTDVVRQIGECRGSSCVTAASLVMTQDVLLCRSSDDLHNVWSSMKERVVKNVPVIDDDGRPIGLVNARDALQLLLQDAENEEAMLRDYVMGVGYR